MYCKNCGKQFEGNFCPNCGAKATNMDENSNAESKSLYSNPYAKANQTDQSKGWQPSSNPNPPISETLQQPKGKRGLDVGLLLKMIGLPILVCLAIGYIRNFILVYTYTNSVWQDSDYPTERVKALNSILLNSEVENITSITPSITNNNEVTMMAGKHEQTSYLISFDANKVSKITSKYGTLYDGDSINESYFYWENRSNLEFSVVVETFVKDYLKSPSSAKFSSSGTCKREKDRAIITSSVTADNSFGVPVSQSYTAVIQQSIFKPDDYILTYLKLGDEVLVNK